MAEVKREPLPSRWQRLKHHRHGPFFIGTVASLTCLPLLLLYLPRFASGIAVVVFFGLYLGLMAPRIPRLDGPALRENGQSTDEPAPMIFGATLLAAVAAVISLFEALNREQPAGVAEIALAFASVVLGWFAIWPAAGSVDGRLR